MSVRAGQAELLVERTAELDAIQALVDAAKDANPHLAVVEGPAGIGKSRLLAELRRRAADAGCLVVSARGTDLECAFPFGVVRQLFEPIVLTPGCPWLTGAAEAAAPVFHAGDSGAHDDVSFGVLHGLYWLVLNIASEGPMAIVVDDLQWSDVPSLRFISYLARRIEGQPVLLAVGIRSAEPGTDAVLLGEIAADPLAVPIRPAPLTMAAVGELILVRLGETPEPGFAEACHGATGGNPLLLHELLKTLAAEGVQPSVEQIPVVRELGSRAVSRTVLVRLARLSPDAIAAARAIAVLGDACEVATVAALAELDERRFATAARELTRVEIVRPDPPLGFVHPLVRDAIYQDLAVGERELMHAAAVDALRAAGAAVEQLAAHWLLLPRRGDPEVAAALTTAGLEAITRGAPDSAVAYLRRALDEPMPEEQRVRTLLDLGHAASYLNLQAAAEYTREALDGLTDPIERARASELLARQLLFIGTGHDALAILEQALAELPPGNDDQRRRLLATTLHTVSFGAFRDDLGDHIRMLRPEAEEDGVGALMIRAILCLGDSFAARRPASEVAPQAFSAMADGTLIAADPGISTIAAIGSLVLAERPEALDFWDNVRGVAYRRASLEAIVGVELWRGWTLLQFGEIGGAVESLQNAVENEAPWALETGQGIIYTSALLARALVEHGDLDAAKQILRRTGTPVPGTDGALFGMLAHAEIAVAEGRFADAIATIDDQLHFVRRVDNPAWLPWRTVKAQALAGRGAVDEAVELIEEDLERARTWGTPGPIGRALRQLGELRRDEALLREAVDVLSGSLYRLELARAWLALGRDIRLDRRPSEAREPLSTALELADSCSAPVVAQAARAELNATGARPRTSARSGAASLTPSELRVAQLAVDGKTNRDIAQELFVTPKTVEVHLSSAYRKLGIDSRHRLAAALTA